MTIKKFENIMPKLAKSVYVDPAAYVAGDVTLGEYSSVWPMAVVRGDVNSIKIGAYSNIQDGSVLHVSHASETAGPGYPLQIGEYVTVGHQVVLHGCTIEDFCLVGIGSCVLDGAHLERYTLLGAGCLVTPGKILESGFLWMGQPAKKIRPLNQKELDYFRYSAEHYVRLAERHRK